MEKNRLNTALLAILTIIALGAVLKAAKPFILPLVIAWFLSFLLSPVVGAMTRKKVPHGLAITLVLVILLDICFLVGVFLHGRILDFVAVYPAYQGRLMDLLEMATTRFDMPNLTLDEINWGQRVGTFLVRLSGSFLVFASKLVMVIIFLVFLLLGKAHSERKIEQAFDPRRAARVISIMNAISAQIRRYLTVQFLISSVTGLLIWAVLTLLGVDFAITWGALAFLLNFIPTIGSIIASIPPILLALVQFYPRYWPAVVTALAVFAVQQVMGSLVSPKMMGDRLNLSPVVVLISLLFWGWLWGPVGAILSVPIASAVKIFCENIEPLRPIGVIMGAGRDHGPASPGPAA